MSEHFPDPGVVGAFVGPEGLGVEHRWVDDVVVVAVSGEVDALTAPALTAAIGEAVARSSPMGVIVDLSQVGFLAAAGLSVLITTHDEVTPKARFGVVAGGAAARSITVLGLDRIIGLYPTWEAPWRSWAGRTSLLWYALAGEQISAGRRGRRGTR